MTDPTIAGAVLGPDEADPHWLDESRETARRQLARIPERYQDAVVDAPEVAAWVMALVDQVREERRTVPRIVHGPSLLLIGLTGTGKTHQAFAAVRALAESGAACPWQAMTAADLYARLRPRPKVDSEGEFEQVARISLLVLDDLAAAKGSEWVEEVNYRLINYRYENRLPTIVTTNIPPKELPAKLGERVFSRLVEMTQRVVLRGSDRRLTAKGSAA